MHVSVRLLTYERSGMPVVFIFVSAQYPTRCRKISRSGNLKAEHSELFFFFCLPPIGSKWYKVLSLWESPNAPPHDPRERKCYLETTSEYTLKARSQSKKNGGFRTNKLWSALWWMIYPLFHTKMFIGSLVASRFLSLIAHFVVTVIIFLSKVSKGINAESVYKFICPGN